MLDAVKVQELPVCSEGEKVLEVKVATPVLLVATADTV